MKRPVVFASILAAIQTLCVILFPQSSTVSSVCACVLAALCLLLCIIKKKTSLLLFFIPIIAISCFSSLTAVTKHEKSSLEFVSSLEDNTDIKYTAVVNECRAYSSYSQIFATITEIDGKKTDKAFSARLGCFSGLALEEGDRVIFSGTPRSVYDIESDGFDTASYLRSRKIFIDFPSISIISSHAAEKTPFLAKMREYTSDIFYKYIPRNSDFTSAGICYAAFAGDKDLIPIGAKDSFSEAGLTHILCVSGMHLAILAGVCYSFLTFLRLHKKLRCLIVIALCVFYTAFTGFSLSTIRACIMCVLCYIGMMSGRKTDAYISLFFSLLIICSFSPYSVIDISFILSFCATLGIICLSEFAPEHNGGSFFQSLISSCSAALLSNLGAVVFTLPVTALSFGGISLMSIISTLAVSFIFEVLLILLLLLVILSPLQSLAFSDKILYPIGSLCNGLGNSITWIAEFFSRFRYCTVSSVYPHIFAALFCTLLLFTALFIALEKQTARKFAVCCVIVLSVVFSLISLIYTAIDDKIYKVTYYRKNENDRQLSIKLENQGYLLINADNNLCTKSSRCPFDTKTGKNYLYVIPDEAITASILAVNITSFNERFGIKTVFVPDTVQGSILALDLYEQGIVCKKLPSHAVIGNTHISSVSDTYFYTTIYDGSVRTSILFSDEYDQSIFDKDSHICAFFTRKTKNQFDTDTDTMPVCNVFYTRLSKGTEAHGIVNTNSLKSVPIKE